MIWYALAVRDKFVEWNKAAAAAGPQLLGAPFSKTHGGPARAALAGPSLLLFAIAGASAAPPKLNYLFPAGGQRGTSVAVTASGEFSNWPPAAWADRAGLAITPDKEKGQLHIEIAKGAVPGTYWLRLYDGEGATQLKPFIVGTLAEVAEAETNDLPDKPQEVKPRVVVNGRLAKPGDVDGYRVTLKQGQMLVASVQASSTLGSPMDSVLQLCEMIERPDATSLASKTEAYVITQNHDAVGVDPQLAFTATKDGAYLVRLFAFPATPDSSIRYAGGEAYVYRLTLTTGGFIDHALPLAVGPGDRPLELGGWNLLHKTAQVERAVDDPLSPPDSPLRWIFHPDYAGALAVPQVEHKLLAGRLTTPGQTDEFAFDAQKDEKLRLRVAAKSLGYPTDATLTILDADGKTVAEADDAGRDDRDPLLEFAPPATGRYRALVRDLAGRGGERLVYRLTIEPVRPDFALSLAADSFVLEKDKQLEIAVNVAATGGLKDAIEFHAIGLPPGITAEPVKFRPTGDAPAPAAGSGRRSRKGGDPPPSGPSVTLVLKGDPAAFQPGSAPLRIEGRTTGDTPLTRTARFPLGPPLAGQHHAIWLTARK